MKNSSEQVLLQVPAQKKPHPKFKFGVEEDMKLRTLVSQLGENNWQQIAQNMPNRNPRQCKERWCNYLSPKICKSPWTHEEDELLLEKVKEIGARWVQIAKFFQNRTDISIKNRYLVLERKSKKEQQKKQVIQDIPKSNNIVANNNNNKEQEQRIQQTNTPDYFPPICLLPPKKAILAIQTRTLLHRPPDPAVSSLTQRFV